MLALLSRLIRPLVLLALSCVLAACASGGDQPPPTDLPRASASPVNAPAKASQPQAEVGLKVGNRAPAFTLTTLDGKALTSAELLAQDKPFILFFFATW